MKTKTVALMTTGFFMMSAAAAQAYKCKQPDGSTSFQQLSCAPSSRQTTVAKPASAKSGHASDGKGAITINANPACAAAGCGVFQELGRHGQHPHAALLRCRKNLQAQQLDAGDPACLQNCMNAWMQDYQSKPAS